MYVWHMSAEPNVFDYLDYAHYLRDYYAWAKERDPSFSHRAFLARADIKGAVYLHRVIHRQRKLNDTFIPNFVRALGLKGKRAEYFKTLVHSCNARPGPAKDRLVRQLLRLRGSQPTHRISNQSLRFYQKWYYPVIRELVVCLDFGDDYNLLANHVVPRITAVQARGAVRYLVRNGFIRKDNNGRYVQTHPTISTGDEVSSTILRNYHRTMLQQSADALDEISPEDRDVTSLTLSVSADNYERIKHEIQRFRKHLLDIASEPQQPQMVCHVGLQLLPRSKKAKQRGEE